MYKSVLDYFEETVKRVPEKKAIRHNEDDCTFAMLQEQAQKLGSYMIELVGDIKNRPIVVLLQIHGCCCGRSWYIIQL